MLEVSVDMSTGGAGDDDDVPHAEWCLSWDPNDAPKKRRALNISRRRLERSVVLIS